MTAAPDPATALAWMRSLSVDVRSAVVLGPDGEPLAGDASLGPRAVHALDAAPGEKELHRGDLLAVRGARVVAAASVRPRALVRLHLADLRAVVELVERGP